MQETTEAQSSGSFKRFQLSKLFPKQKLQKAEDSTNQFGLFRLNSPAIAPQGGTDSGDLVLNYPADIIAIHGLGGGPYRSWTHENGKLWLRDFALDCLPGTRIYTFGYDSGFAFSKGTGTLRDFARSLLEAIRLERLTMETSSRPLVFICHSMGGIVAKLALIMARNEPQNYPGISTYLTAILFLGTPHQGSSTARYAAILAQTANVAIIGSQASRFTGVMRTGLLKTLQRHESELLSIAEDFRYHTSNIKIASFVEGKITQGLNTLVVDSHSAYVGASTERKIPMPGYDHRGICKHGSLIDPGLKLILGVLKEFLSPDGVNLPNEVLSDHESKRPKPFIYIPLMQNPDFVGQKSILNELELIVWNKNGPRDISLYGLGGIGKSQIALKLVYWVKEMLPHTSVFWVFAGTRERFEHDYEVVAKGLKLPGYKDPETDYLSLVKRCLDSGKYGRWIMIVDNADDLSIFYDSLNMEPSLSEHKSCTNDLLNYIPEERSGIVIYTTRNKADALKLTGEGKIIHVTEMCDDDLMAILGNKLGHDVEEDDDRLELIKILQRVPLAIVQAASYIRRNSWPVAKYLKYFGQNDEDLSVRFLLHDFQDKTRDKGVANAIFKTWIITVHQLENYYPRAAEVLWMMAFFNNQHIPRFLLVNSPAGLTPRSNGFKGREFSGDESRNESELMREYYLDEAIGTLRAYSFINIVSSETGEAYTLHRLVQMFSRYWLKSRKLNFVAWESRMLTALVQEWPKQEYEEWDKAAQLLPHAQGFMDSLSARQQNSKDLGVLLTSVSTYLRMKGQYALAEKYVRAAIDTLHPQFGDDDPLTLEARVVLALVWRETDRLNEAEELLRSIVEKAPTLGLENDKKTIRTKMHLSSLFRRQKRYDEAISICGACVSAFENLEGPEGTSTLESKMTLATILGSDGKQEEALQLQRDVAQVIERRYPDNHPRVLGLHHDLAVTLNLAGKAKEAQELSESVFQRSLSVYGLDHPRTSSIEFNLSLALFNQNKFEEAEEHFRSVMRHLSDMKDNLRALQCWRCLALCLKRRGQYKESRLWFNMALREIAADPNRLEITQQQIQDDIKELELQEKSDPFSEPEFESARERSTTLLSLASYASGVYALNNSCVVS